MNVTAEMVPQIVREAQEAAHQAAAKFFQEKLGGRDQWACGFAWVNIYGVKGNTKVGRALAKAGIRKAYGGGLQMWNPSKRVPMQPQKCSSGMASKPTLVRGWIKFGRVPGIRAGEDSPG